jgi:CHAT domain-containing protein
VRTVAPLALLLTLALGAGPSRADPAPGATTTADLQEADRLLAGAWQLATTDAVGYVQRLRRAVALYERALGPASPRLAGPLGRLGHGLFGTGDTPGALKVYARLLALQERTLGPDHIDVGQTLATMALIRGRAGDFTAGEALFRRALAIHEKAYGPRSPRLATFLIIQATSYSSIQDYARAYALVQRAVSIAELDPGAHGERLAGPLLQLAWLCKYRGRVDEAARHFRRVLDLSSGRPGGEILAATVLEQLARIAADGGRTAEAEGYFRRAEKVYQAHLADSLRRFGADSPMATSAKGLLASHYRQRGQRARAVALLEEILATARKLHGPDTLAVATDEIQLAEALRQEGKLDRARALFGHALTVQEKTLGAASASGVIQLLAILEHDAGRFAAARGLTERARRGFVRLLGPRHLVVAQLLQREAILWWAQGKVAPALARLRESLDIMEPLVTAVLSAGTEEDKRLFLDNIAYQVHAVAALHALAAPRDRQALALALTTVLRRKGRALDAYGAGLRALRMRLTPADRELFDRLAAARGTLAKLVLKAPPKPPPQLVRQIAELERSIRELEQVLASRSSEIRAQGAPVTIATVPAALPADGALVELLAVQPPPITRSAASGPPDPAARRYVAYVLPAKGPPGFADLGPQADVDAAVARLRAALAAKRADVRDPAQALGEKVMRPLKPLLGRARHLFLSPDGVLNLVPFGALVDDQGQFELQHYTFTYLTSGRDLLRLRAGVPSRGGDMVVANPDFGPPAAARADDGPLRGRRSVDLRNLSWAALPGTAAEGRLVAGLLPHAHVIAGAAATETALKHVAGPRILHVATHGFFLQPQEDADDTGPENPLLRAGLLLSGANRRDSGVDDGILTALEASGLDLAGTKLVVLSACETGLGQVRAGDGVYGLRRALVIAGAESQVMSLWKVDDQVTRDLMVIFYRGLLAGKGRAAALRDAQLAILARRGNDNPFYWAGFIPVGDWRPLR